MRWWQLYLVATIILAEVTCSVSISRLLGTTAAPPVNDDPYSNLILRMRPGLEDCDIILDNTKKILEAASQVLYIATEDKLFFKDVTILVPSALLSLCRLDNNIPQVTKMPKVAIILGEDDPVFGGEPWTQQTQGCGKPGDFLYLPHAFLRSDNASSLYSKRGKRVVHEWAKVRWGVFEEYGIAEEQVFPLDSAQTASDTDNSNNWLPNYCANADLHGEFRQQCEFPSCSFILEEEQNATSSLLALYTPASVTSFCDSDTHKSLLPNKHNAQCGGQSVTTVLQYHHDFQRTRVPMSDFSVRLLFKQYSTEPLTEYVILLDVTEGMSNDALQERWTLLKAALQQWILTDVLLNTSLGITTFTTTTDDVCLMTVVTQDNRQDIADSLPKSPDITETRKNVAYALEDVSKYMEHGTIIMVVNPDYVFDSAEAMVNAAGSNVVWPILFPVSAPLTNTPFKTLAEETGGRVLEVFDQRFNFSHQSLSVQHSVVQHLRTIQDNTLRYTSYIPKLQVTQQQLFSNPATIEFFLANDTEASSLFLYSHCQSSYIEINNKPVPVAINITPTSSIMLLSNLQRGWNIIEVGFEECSEPQLAEVLVQQEEEHLQVELWASHDLSFLDLTNPQDPVVLFVKVTQDSRLIVGAQVVVVFLVGNDKYELPLYDNGGGSPDVTGGDGVYSRYLVYVPNGRSTYTLQVNVSSTASSKIVGTTSNTKPDVTCCGSSLPIHLLPAQDFTANYVSVMGSAVVVEVPGLSDIFPPARVTDLRAHTSEDQVILTFTAPGDDLDRGYAMEYRVFWSDDGDKWVLVDTATYVVVEGGSVAQVMVSPILRDQLVYYRVRARDTRMQEGQDSNVASIQSSCSSLTTFVPTESPIDGCPSHAGAICGAFFGGLVTGVLIAALAYFLYFRFCKTSDKALPTSSHVKQSNVQNSTTNRLNTSYTNPAFSPNDSGNSQRSTPDQNRALPSLPPPRESIQTSSRDRGSRNLAKPEVQVTQTRSPSGTTQTKPLSIQINQTGNPLVQANQNRPLSAQIPQHSPPVEITQPRPLSAQIPQHGPPVQITQPRPPSAQILQHSPPVEITQPRLLSAQIPQHRPPVEITQLRPLSAQIPQHGPPVEITQPRPPSAQIFQHSPPVEITQPRPLSARIPQHGPPVEITQPRPLSAQVTHTRRPSANVTLPKSNSLEVSQIRRLSSGPSVPPQLPRQYSVHVTPPAVPPRAGYISDEDDANDDTASQTSELIYDTAYS